MPLHALFPCRRLALVKRHSVTIDAAHINDNKYRARGAKPGYAAMPPKAKARRSRRALPRTKDQFSRSSSTLNCLMRIEIDACREQALIAEKSESKSAARAAPSVSGKGRRARPPKGLRAVLPRVHELHR